MKATGQSGAWRNRSASRAAAIRRRIKAAWLPLAGLVLIVSFYLAAGWYSFSHIDEQVQAVTVAAGADTRAPVAQLMPGKLVLFQQALGEEEIRFVIARSSQGDLRAAVTSCSVCYQHRGRHSVRESGVICARCRHRMRVPRPTDGQAKPTCDLVKLPHHTEGDAVVVSTNALAEAVHGMSEGLLRSR